MGTSKQSRRKTLLLQSGLDEVRVTDIIIVVMGQTKAGKTTLINDLVDDETKHKAVGHRMVSETSETSVVVVDRAPSQYPGVNRLLNGRRIVLVDTPGFNDSTMNDAVILTNISQWLMASYGEGMRVGGVLHLRDISQNGWNGIERRDFNVFSKLCGDDSMAQVSLVTTKWGKLYCLRDGAERVEELLNEHWRWAIEKGASVFHLQDPNSYQLSALELDGIVKSPWHIIQQIVTSMDALAVANRVLHIQKELANKKYFLSESDAGKEVQYTLNSLLSQAKDYQRGASKDCQSLHAKKHLEKRREEIEGLAQQLNDLEPSFAQLAKRWWNRNLLSMFRSPFKCA